MKALETAGLILGLCEAILGVVYLVFRWEPRWLGRGRPWAFSRGLMEVFGAMFIISFLLPKVAAWHGVTASVLALIATVSLVLFLTFGFVPSIGKRRGERSILPPSS
ncbi:MAG TPA: hypothetical protein VME44_18525 [Streptosporangiaceae bacterium]|nr:hypothetical protein [Streptosporangiaceae bacterium]